MKTGSAPDLNSSGRLGRYQQETARVSVSVGFRDGADRSPTARADDHRPGFDGAPVVQDQSHDAGPGLDSHHARIRHDLRSRAVAWRTCSALMASDRRIPASGCQTEE